MDQNTNQGTQPTGAQPAAPASEPQAQPQPAQPVQPTVPQPAPAAQPAQDTRTKEQFDKLLESNRKLFEANELLRQDMERRSQVNQTFAPVQQQPQTQANPDDFMDVDPTTGEKFANAEKLKAKIDELNARATRAEQSVQNYIKSTEEKESAKQNQEAFTAYPELNPKGEKFDLEFHKQTRALIYDSLINPQDYGGRPLEFKEAADRAISRGVSSNIMNQAEENPTANPTAQPAQPAPESAEQTQKEQGSLQATAQPSAQATAQINKEADLEELRYKTREGRGVEEKNWAIAQRLTKINHVGTPTHGSEE